MSASARRNSNFSNDLVSMTPAARRRASEAPLELLPQALPADLLKNTDGAHTCPECATPFSVFLRKHHCRYCGLVYCDGCSARRIRSERTCPSCWDRLGRRMSGLGPQPACSPGGSRLSVLGQLLAEDRFNQELLVEGQRVSYSLAGSPDGLPVFVLPGLDHHRHLGAHFEALASRRGLRLICFDRPGRGHSDALPSSSGKSGEEEGARESSVIATVKELCRHLSIGRAGLLGCSLGSIFVLALAADQELAPVFSGTTVCLVSPWVPLEAPGTLPTLQRLSKLPKDLRETVGKLAGDILPRLLGGGVQGASGASSTEQSYLEAPFTQELLQHLTDLKESRASIPKELVLAFRNTGCGEEALQAGFQKVVHDVHIWHGRNDHMVPCAAAKWLQAALPRCDITVKAGGTHALLYDRGEVDHVFVTLQTSIVEARESERSRARRRSSGVTYVATEAVGGGVEATSTGGTEALNTPAGLPSLSVSGSLPVGCMSPRGRRRQSVSHSPPVSQVREPVEGTARAGGESRRGVVSRLFSRVSSLETSARTRGTADAEPEQEQQEQEQQEVAEECGGVPTATVLARKKSLRGSFRGGGGEKKVPHQGEGKDEEKEDQDKKERWARPEGGGSRQELEDDHGEGLRRGLSMVHSFSQDHGNVRGHGNEEEEEEEEEEAEAGDKARTHSIWNRMPHAIRLALAPSAPPPDADTAVDRDTRCNTIETSATPGLDLAGATSEGPGVAAEWGLLQGADISAGRDGRWDPLKELLAHAIIAAFLATLVILY